MNIRQRQDALLRSLRRGGPTTVSVLAEELGVSKRTILRDLSSLRDQGVVIESESGRGGGLQLDLRSLQTTVTLSVAEVFALLISVTSMYANGGVPFNGLADRALEKIEQALPQEKLHDLRRLLDCLYIGELAAQVDTSNIGKMHPDLLPAFEHAFLKQQYLRFDYCDAKGAVTHRQVEPQAMLILPPLWYLVAWDPTRNAFRYFRMDRITVPEVMESLTFLRKNIPFTSHVSPARNMVR
ncbi:WYL domain-containing protein [Vibrio sp. JPW-9-11-11]|uniref:helix-turn-helix transcriptional regulator n=1 Tax=Vibrio sp. JPW-9-11-11 TaxID=1416532 RepID=UPI001592C484|nr:WYL domain-containing protein [Vibrio sp. JPW-9-11-11]NVD06804.1 WYL domain-containing protein [Vibrio sp. JPW-9-11-11]